MNISLFSAQQAQDIYNVYPAYSQNKNNNLGFQEKTQGDRATFSPEALALVEELMKKKAQEAKILSGESELNSSTKDNENKKNDTNLSDNLRSRLAQYSKEDTVEGAGKASAAQGSGSSDKTPQDRIEEIEKKIKELEEKLAAIYTSDQPEEIKEGKATAIRAQIHTLSLQKTELMQSAKKQA